MPKLTKFFLPVPAGTKIASEYGQRDIGKQQYHYGIDFSVASGIEVKSVGSGEVMRAISNHKEFGNVVIVKHADDQATLYAHLDEIGVNVNDKVSEATILGLSGSTGRSTGAHLHFEVIEGKENIDAIKSAEDANLSSIGIKGSVGRINPRQFFAHYLDVDFPTTIIAGASSYGVTSGDSRDNKIYANSRQNTLEGLGGFDTYHFPTISGHDIIDDVDANGKIKIGGTDLSTLNSANAKFNSVTGEVIEGEWTLGSYYLTKNGDDLVISSQDSSASEASITIKNYPFNDQNKQAPFGINLGREFVQNAAPRLVNPGSDGPSILPYYEGAKSSLFTTSDKKKFFTIVDAKDEVGYYLGVRTYDDSGNMLNNQVLHRNMYESRYRDVASTVKSPPIMYQMDNGDVALLYRQEFTDYNRRDQLASIRRAHLVMIGNDGKVISDDVVAEANQWRFGQSDLNCRPLSVSNKGACFYSSNNYKYFCGTLESKQTELVTDLSPYQGESQSHTTITMASGAIITTGGYRVPGTTGSKLTYLQLSDPIYAEIPIAQKVKTYDIASDYQTDASLDKFMISMIKGNNAKLEISENPACVGVVCGLDINSDARLVLPYQIEECAIYKASSSDYTIDDLLNKKFTPTNPLNLASNRRLNAKDQEEEELIKKWGSAFSPEELRNLASTNSSVNITDDDDYYYGDYNNTIGDDDYVSDGDILLEEPQSHTVITMPNNQTVILIGVNASEVVKNPEIYFLAQTEITKSPTCNPSSEPSSEPSSIPTSNPTGIPSSNPSSIPSHHPTAGDLIMPTSQPTGLPSSIPSSEPSNNPSGKPSSKPSSEPSNNPSSNPSGNPSGKPSGIPSVEPSSEPSSIPTSNPTGIPSSNPSSIPSHHPTAGDLIMPTSRPTGLPSSIPSSEPSNNPSGNPSGKPSLTPFADPSAIPSYRPQAIPSFNPTGGPSSKPSREPSGEPSSDPSSHLSGYPSSSPNAFPSAVPTFDVQETLLPTNPSISNGSDSKPSSIIAPIVGGIGAFALVGGALAVAYKFCARSGKVDTKDNGEDVDLNLEGQPDRQNRPKPTSRGR